MKQEPTFLVCGEALMDVYPSGDARIGGSPLNVAIGLARMGQRVAFLGSISRDPFGERLYAALSREGVDVSVVQRSDAPTTQSIVGIDATGTPTYEFRGEGCADRQLMMDVIDRLPQSVRAIHVGSYAMVVEPIASTLRALVARTRDSQLVAWDPNVRSTVVREPHRWRELVDWMLPRCDLIKLSDEDLGVLVPRLTPAQFAQHALAHGVALVVATHGSNGASAWSAAGGVHVPAPEVKVADTVGAGDAFQAALLTWLAEHDVLARERVGAIDSEGMRGALSFAARAAALACGHSGATR